MQEPTYDHQPELRLLDPATLLFTRHGSRLRLTIRDEASWLKVSVVRAFPYAAPDRYLSVLDSKDAEIGIIEELQRLDRESQASIAADLERRYRLPDILSVINIRERFGTQEWSVETDRGACRFTTRDLFDNARVNSDGYIVLTDVDGNRFRLPPLDQLDQQSRFLLETHL